MFYGDYHTHTRYSHGKGMVEDNVKRAAELSLKEIAITDHGLSHIAFGLSDTKVFMLKEDIEEAQKIYKDVKIFCGVESNIVGLDGTIDLIDEEFDWFDIVLCGYHKFVWPNTVKDFFKYFLGNYMYDIFRTNASAKLITKNTDAYINAISKNCIDIITHVNLGLRVDCKEIAKAAKEFGTFMELNGKRMSFSEKEFEDMAGTGVDFIINSDAHSISRISDFSLPLAFMEKVGYPKENLVNYGKKPNFRTQRERAKKLSLK